VKKRPDSRGIILVPTAVFCDRTLSISESLVDYLWTVHGLSPSKIGKELSMDRRNVWTIMQRLSRKRELKKPDVKISDNVFVPVSIFSERSVSVLESIVGHLSSLDLSNKAIALLLNRSQKTIWTVKHRLGGGLS